MRTGSILNMSVSKEQHAFSKSARFPKNITYTSNTNPEQKPSDFDLTVKSGRGKGKHDFGSKVGRFRFSFTPHHNVNVGPLSYKITDVFSPSSPFKKSARFTFGVSREAMKKEFVDDCTKNSPLSPAPNTYRDPPRFG